MKYKNYTPQQMWWRPRHVFLFNKKSKNVFKDVNQMKFFTSLSFFSFSIIKSLFVSNLSWEAMIFIISRVNSLSGISWKEWKFSEKMLLSCFKIDNKKLISFWWSSDMSKNKHIFRMILTLFSESSIGLKKAIFTWGICHNCKTCLLSWGYACKDICTIHLENRIQFRYMI